MKLNLFIFFIIAFCTSAYSQNCDCFIYPIKTDCRKNCGLKLLNEGSSKSMVENLGIRDSTAQIIIDYRSKKNINAIEDLKAVLPGDLYLEFDDAYAYWNSQPTDLQRKLDIQAQIKNNKDDMQSAKHRTITKLDATVSKDSLAYGVFTVVDENPEYPGGPSAMEDFLTTNVKYPESAKNTGFTGYVYVGFVVEKDGSLSNIKITEGLKGDIGSDCNAEAIRLISSMPKWKPAIRGVYIVKAYKTVSVQFKATP